MSKYTSKVLAALPAGMLFAGLDLGLDSLVVVVLDHTGRRVARFRVVNRRGGYAELRQRLAHTVQHHGGSGVLVGMEPTNYYWKQVGYDLEQHHVPFRLVNALTVKRHREGDQLDRSKDDWRDAHTIADLMRTGKFTQTHLPHGVYAELQTGYTAYWRLRQDHARQVTLLRNSVRQLLPEFEQVFAKCDGATAAAVLAAGVAPAQMRSYSVDAYVAQVRRDFGGQRLARQRVVHLHTLAAQSEGLPEATHALQLLVQQQSATLQLLQHQAATLLAQLCRLFRTLPEAPYLLSIQGLSEPLALGLVAHTGDLREYHSGAALVKLAGTQPTPRHSGRKTYSATPFSHQGRKGLRTVLYFSALRMLTRNDAIAYQYHRWTTRAIHPLPKMQALGACMNKVLWYSWHVVTTQTFYDPNYWRRLDTPA